jgi:conjugal transfer pilus assembly protein TraW
MNFNLNYYKNLKYYQIVLVLLCSLFIAKIAQTKNLGVWGQLFPIEEQDIREFIYQRLNEMEQNGEMTKLNKKFIKNVKEHTLRPTPVFGLTTIKEPEKPKTFYYDPTYVLTKNIEDHEGNLIAKKGTTINPLDTVKLHGVLFFLDTDDERQIKWALENTKKHDYVKFILIKGNIKEAGNKLNDRIYFDQYGLITKQLGIKHIPCIVKQEGKKLQIQEFSLEDGADKQNTVPTK